MKELTEVEIIKELLMNCYTHEDSPKDSQMWRGRLMLFIEKIINFQKKHNLEWLDSVYFFNIDCLVFLVNLEALRSKEQNDLKNMLFDMPGAIKERETNKIMIGSRTKTQYKYLINSSENILEVFNTNRFEMKNDYFFILKENNVVTLEINKEKHKYKKLTKEIKIEKENSLSIKILKKMINENKKIDEIFKTLMFLNSEALVLDNLAELEEIENLIELNIKN